MVNSFPNLSQEKFICVDIETYDPAINNDLSSGHLRGGYICGVSLATEGGFSEYYPIAHEGGGNLERDLVLNYLKIQLGRKEQIKVGHNIKYDISYLEKAGVKIEGPLYDTGIAEGLLDENRGKRGYSLESISQKYTGVGKDSEYLYDFLAAKFGGKPTRQAQARNIWRAPAHIVKPYAISDVVQPLQIIKKQLIFLEEQNLLPLFEIENSLIPLLIAMQNRGVRIDVDKVEIMKKQYSEKINTLEKEIYSIFGKQFNLASHKQLGELFESLGVDGVKTPTGKLKTDKLALSLMTHPAAKKLLELSESRTLLNTFLNGQCTKHLINGRIHGELHNMISDEGGTVTGRFSASKPNLQNVAKKGAIRTLFLPEVGETWYCNDLSQIEYRLLVHYARGKEAEIARQSYLTSPDTDYHNYTKQMIMSQTNKDIDRGKVKIINFGLMYTKGKKSLAADLNLPIAEASVLFDTYHAALPYVRETLRKFERRAQDRGYVHTLLNRRRRFDTWEPREFGDRRKPLPRQEALELYGTIKRAKTKDSLNFGLQGGCADYMKKGLSEIWKAGICKVLGAPLTMVHDENNFSVPDTVEGREAHDEAVHIMQTCIKISVPILVNTKCGTNWGDLK